MELYKLTNKNGCTQGNTQWGIGVTHKLKATEKTSTLYQRCPSCI